MSEGILMAHEVQALYEDLVNHAQRYGIQVEQTQLAEDVPGEFDGPAIRLNKQYDATERAFYLAHSIGSIAEWSIHPRQTEEILQELRQAKKVADSDSVRFQRALLAYLAFETRTWEFAVWLLKDTRHEPFVAPFTNFGRADLEAMRVLHTTGKAPVWREFFAMWNEEVAAGRRTVLPFTCRPIPPFQAIKIPKQEIVQESW